MFTYCIENIVTGEKVYLTCFSILRIGQIIGWGTDDGENTAQWKVIC